MNLNKVMLAGNLTRDPEVRFTAKGTPVTDIGLAMNRVYSTDAGERGSAGARGLPRCKLI